MDGNSYISSSYLTNGSGAIAESDMPFENNEDVIDISQIQNKKVISQVYDTEMFAKYTSKNSEEMRKIKEHIQNFGSVFATLHGNSIGTNGERCYNNETGAKYCSNSSKHYIDHAVSIIGWDDNYSIENFVEGQRPKENGAWIVKNSWGERIENWLSVVKKLVFYSQKDEFIKKGINSPEQIPNEIIEKMGYTIEGDKAYLKYGDKGIIYVSYEDANISTGLTGISKAKDKTEYDYIYQYDELYPTNLNKIENSNKFMLCNKFDKKTNGTEFLTQVGIDVFNTYTCKVYVNPNGTEISKEKLQLVQLKDGESETFSTGYHTLEFAKPIKLTGSSYAVVIEVESEENESYVLLESKIEGTIWDKVAVENGRCFFTLGNDLDKCEWIDLGKLSEYNPGSLNADSSIKAFTVKEYFDESLSNIEIITPPNKVNYIEGENFDKTGMVVKANYNSKTKPYVILDNSSYNILDGTNLKAGQATVQITYEDKSTSQKINVEKNDIVKLKITASPSKVNYVEGENFDKTGMIVEATYRNGLTKTILDYKIENGNNLKKDQTFVKITFDGQSIKQEITVIENKLVKIKITKEPNKKQYVVGQNFDKTGMVVVGIYVNEITQEITDYTIEDGTNLTKNQTFVRIKYQDKEEIQPIEVKEKSIVEISIKRKPSKLTYKQDKETLDLSGGSIIVKYNDNSNEEISLTSEQIEATGFNNKKIGKQIITITYQSNKTTFEIEIVEMLENEMPKNSNFDEATCKINNIKYYIFSDKNKKEYAIIDVTLNNIKKNKGNDKVEYYYYLSSNKQEENINNWAKIAEEQPLENKLEFKINTNDVQNFEELYTSSNLYIYVKEVAIKGGNQTTITSNAIEMSTTDSIELYLDNNKVTDDNQDDEDKTVAKKPIPQTGLINVLISVLLIIIIGSVFFVKYKKISKYIK